MSNPIEVNGYKALTTFWEDFTIADRFGVKAMMETFEAAFNEWKDNYKYLTELTLVVNHKCWKWYWTAQQYNEQGDRKLADLFFGVSKLYSDWYYKCRDYASENMTPEEYGYFFEVTD